MRLVPRALALPRPPWRYSIYQLWALWWSFAPALQQLGHEFSRFSMRMLFKVSLCYGRERGPTITYMAVQSLDLRCLDWPLWSDAFFVLLP